MQQLPGFATVNLLSEDCLSVLFDIKLIEYNSSLKNFLH